MKYFFKCESKLDIDLEKIQRENKKSNFILLDIEGYNNEHELVMILNDKIVKRSDMVKYKLSSIFTTNKSHVNFKHGTVKEQIDKRVIHLSGMDKNQLIDRCNKFINELKRREKSKLNVEVLTF
jgi:hypothetical protein